MHKHVEIYLEIQRISPKALPGNLGLQYGHLVVGTKDEYVFHSSTERVLIARPWVPDDIAEAVLIAAMVMDGSLAYDKERRRWCGGGPFHSEFQYGGPLGACHAAWRWAHGLSD